MDAVTIIPVVLVVALAAVAVVAALMMRRRRSAQLRQTFGTEYERTVEGADDRTRAEKHLRHRGKRRATLELQRLSHDSAIRYGEQWNGIQQRFVDEPAHAVQQADRLVVEVMRERGNPVDDLDQRAGDASADHPEITHHYRDAHGPAVDSEAGTFFERLPTILRSSDAQTNPEAGQWRRRSPQAPAASRRRCWPSWGRRRSRRQGRLGRFSYAPLRQATPWPLRDTRGDQTFWVL